MAYLWYAEQEVEFNPFNEEEESLEGKGYGKAAEDGWVDYLDNVSQVDEKEEVVKHGEVFDIEEYKKGLAAAPEFYDETGQKPLQGFIIPKQVKSLNMKIRTLFHR